MVRSDGGQLYTIEGISAGLIMIMTAYLVVSATSVYTAGDTHISDMQLEQLGTDALKVMDIPLNKDTPSNLNVFVTNDDGEGFKKMFLNLTDNRTLSGPDHIQFTASYTCRDNADNSVDTYPLSYSRNLSGGEHAVRATKWVIVNKNVCNNNYFPVQDRAVLVEVLMWRD
jgi:hypothetical protein